MPTTYEDIMVIVTSQNYLTKSQSVNFLLFRNKFTGTGFVQFFLGFNTIMSSEKKFGKRVSSVWPPSGIYIENIMVSNEKEVKFSKCPLSLSLSLSLRQLYQEQKTKRLKTLEIS